MIVNIEYHVLDASFVFYNISQRYYDECYIVLNDQNTPFNKNNKQLFTSLVFSDVNEVNNSLVFPNIDTAILIQDEDIEIIDDDSENEFIDDESENEMDYFILDIVD